MEQRRRFDDFEGVGAERNDGEAETIGLEIVLVAHFGGTQSVLAVCEGGARMHVHAGAASGARERDEECERLQAFKLASSLARKLRSELAGGHRGAPDIRRVG